MRSLFMLFILLSCGKVFAQAPDTLWTRTFGGVNNDSCKAISLMPDGGFMLAGSNAESFLAIRTDASGNEIWRRTYGNSFYAEWRCHCMVVLEDNTVVLAGEWSSFDYSNYNYWMIKISSSGDSLWSKSYGGTGYDRCESIASSPDGGFVLAGMSYSFSESNLSWVLKVDANGDSMWSVLIQGHGCKSVVNSQSEGYFVASRQDGGNDLRATKLTEQGLVEWSRTYGGPNVGDVCESVCADFDGGCVLAGQKLTTGVFVSDFSLIKLDVDGNEVWSKRYFDTLDSRPRYVARTSDGGLITAGRTGEGDADFIHDLFVIRTDINGDSIWSMTIGGNGSEEARSLVELDDGSYAIAGHTQSGGAGSSDMWLLRTSPDPATLYGVVFPNGSEELGILAPTVIQWTSLTFEVHVSLEINYSFPVGSWEVIVDSTANDGEFTWQVPNLLSNACRIRICGLDGVGCDISDGNFSIVSSQGYLALVKSNQPTLPLTSWNGGVVECPSAVSQWFRVKNFGSESIVVFQPQEPTSSEFSRTTTCGGFFALAPNQMSSCSLLVTFDPAGNGSYSDVLRIQTDAVNGVDGFVEIDLSGAQISTPAAPNVVISPAGLDVNLNWSVVDTTVGGCAVSDLWYAVFYSPTSGGPFYYHGWTPDTSYTHYGVVNFSPTQFYQVVAVGAPEALARELEEGEEMGSVLGKIGNRK